MHGRKLEWAETSLMEAENTYMVSIDIPDDTMDDTSSEKTTLASYCGGPWILDGLS